MSSSQDKAMSVIKQWSERETSLLLILTGLGISMKVFNVQVGIDEPWEGMRITKPPDPSSGPSSEPSFELVFKLWGWTRSTDTLPNGRRRVIMHSGEGVELSLDESA
jgi:hypothetical protein